MFVLLEFIVGGIIQIDNVRALVVVSLEMETPIEDAEILAQLAGINFSLEVLIIINAIWFLFWALRS